MEGFWLTIEFRNPANAGFFILCFAQKNENLIMFVTKFIKM